MNWDYGKLVHRVTLLSLVHMQRGFIVFARKAEERDREREIEEKGEKKREKEYERHTERKERWEIRVFWREWKNKFSFCHISSLCSKSVFLNFYLWLLCYTFASLHYLFSPPVLFILLRIGFFIWNQKSLLEIEVLILCRLDENRDGQGKVKSTRRYLGGRK